MRCYICDREADETTDDGLPICFDCKESVDLTLMDYDDLVGVNIEEYLKNEDKDE